MRPDAEYATLLEFKGEANDFIPKGRWLKANRRNELKVLLSVNI